LENIEIHNRCQQEYFGRGIKPTMVPERTRYVMRHVKEAVQAGGLKAGDRVLEVGCGMGRHAFIMADMGLQVEGVDLSSFLLEQFRIFDAGRYCIPVYQADVHRLPEHLYSRFDAVVGFFVLHHLMDLRLAFAGISQALVPGGRLIFVEPNPYNPLFYVQILISPGMSWRAEKGITRLRGSVLRTAAESAGLQHFSIRRFGLFPPQFVNRSWGSALEKILESWGHWGPLWAFQLIRADKP
jgi:SAM-dependent methyltransferase